jgi:hypothetical protein
MKITELYEGAEPRLPGAVQGIKIMTPQQFAGIDDNEEVDEDWKKTLGTAALTGAMALGSAGASARVTPDGQGGYTGGLKPTATVTAPSTAPARIDSPSSPSGFSKEYLQKAADPNRFGRYMISVEKAQELLNGMKESVSSDEVDIGPALDGLKSEFDKFLKHGDRMDTDPAYAEKWNKRYSKYAGHSNSSSYGNHPNDDMAGYPDNLKESTEHLARIRRLSGLDEATALPAQQRELGGDEFQDYMTRIKGTDDLDKEGNVKLDKKGIAKYTTGKTKTDKYKMPYVHRSSAIEYYDEGGKRFKEEAVIQALQQRPKKLLKQNEKMKHSNGEFEQFFNVGFAALTGVAVDESTNKLIIVNTCPGAGSCKVDCFAMKGGKVQFKAAWLSDGRILTYLLNDPSGFFNQLSSEIASEEAAANKGDKKFPNGWQVTVRWHDAGDFFSPEYLELALNMAAKHPNVKFYAYTKMAAAALSKKPDNFIINWSEGANTTQEKQVKQQDPNLDNTKNSRIVPEKLFYDLLAKDEKGNLKKTADGAWQPANPEALTQMKQRIAKEYGISASSILSYTEYMGKRNSIPSGMKYNVIVAPGEGDVSANDQGVLSTLLLRH